jgi:hypothetical protein
MTAVPVLTPEGIVLVAPRIGWNAIFTGQDRVRWANLYMHLKRKGLSPEGAEREAFLLTWKTRDPALKY